MLGKRSFVRLGNETIGLERLRYIAIPAAIKRLDHYHQGRPEYKTHLMQMPSDQEEIRVIFQLFLKATFYHNVLLKHQQLLHQH